MANPFENLDSKAIGTELEKLGNDIENINVKVEDLRNQQKPMVVRRNELEASLALAKKVDAMSPAERKLLGIPEPQTVAAEPIKSEESVQGPA